MPKVQKRKDNSRQGGIEGLRNRAVGAAASRGKLPTKRTINFAQVGIKKTNVKGAVAGVIQRRCRKAEDNIMPKVQKRKDNSRQGGIEGLRNRAVGAAASRGKLPTKRTINFAQVGIKKTNVKGAVAGVILILIAAGAFGKFAVADRLAAMARADQETQRLQGLLEQQYARIASFEGLEDEYAHYTISGMTDEELSLVDRAKVIDMIEKETDITESSTSWSLNSNILTLTVTGDTLQDINVLARRLEKYDLVNTCSVTNAVKEEVKKTTTINANGTVTETRILVRANIVAYLEEPQEEGEEAESK